jgi:UDP-GlcNAc:undecaprenyl-phosphate GlcNAc-1-phosphate transferase
LDRPGHRKVHEHVMPKCGGMAMAIGAVVPILLWAPKTNFVHGLLIGSLIIVCFGLADDIKDLKPNVKLLGQTMAALIIILIGGTKISDLGGFWISGAALPDWVAIPLTVIVVIGVTNATNLSDGLDGLAGGIALLIFLCIGYLGVLEKDWIIVMIAIAAGGSVLGFLRFNSYPAQLFMGDAGSQLLGFVAVVLAIKLAQQSAAISAIIPLIIFGIPILDTLTVSIKRLAAGRSPFSADRNHFHHQLIAIGLYHTEAVVAIYLTQALLILFTIVYHGSNDWVLLSIYLLFACIVSGIFYLFHKTDYRINRTGSIKVLKARLKPLKDRGQIIKFSYGIVRIAVPALIFFNAFFQQFGNTIYLLLSASFLILIVLAWFIDKKTLNRFAKVALYFFTPFMIYRCDLTLYANLSPLLIGIYNSLYLVLLASMFLTMKLTRRSNGFKSSTLDFLVIFVILLIPNLPDSALKGYLLGLVAVKTVILYYSYEVLTGEMRRTSNQFSISAAVFILILGAKGVITFF